MPWAEDVVALHSVAVDVECEDNKLHSTLAGKKHGLVSSIFTSLPSCAFQVVLQQSDFNLIRPIDKTLSDFDHI